MGGDQGGQADPAFDKPKPAGTDALDAFPGIQDDLLHDLPQADRPGVP